MKGRIVLLGGGMVLALVVLLLLAQFGVPFPFALAWILVVVTIGVVSRQAFFDETHAWPPDERALPVRGSDVSRLSWSLNGHTGVAGHVVVRRVERIVRRRLSHRGFDLDDPGQYTEIDALLGAGIRTIFQQKVVRLTDIERALDAAEKLPFPNEEK